MLVMCLHHSGVGFAKDNQNEPNDEKTLALFVAPASVIFLQ
jgi:hypothetical protein